MKLSLPEQHALLRWIFEQDQVRFDTFLQSAVNVRLHEFSSVLLSMETVSLHFTDWLDRHPRQVLPILERIVRDYPQHESSVALDAARVRVAAAMHRQIRAGPASRVSLIDGVPIVNRAELRQALEGRINANGRHLLLVDGPEGSGRTHSWYLIRHVAREAAGVHVTRIDLEKQSLSSAFEALVSRLGLRDRVRMPTEVGITASTLADRLVSALETALCGGAPVGTHWIVFDGADRPQEPASPIFLCQFMRVLLEGSMPGVSVFVLGAGLDYGFEDPFELVESETLGRFTPQEIADAARAINGLGDAPLDNTVLAERIRAICDQLASQTGLRDCLTRVRQGLVKLRKEVAA